MKEIIDTRNNVHASLVPSSCATSSGTGQKEVNIAGTVPTMAVSLHVREYIGGQTKEVTPTR